MIFPEEKRSFIEELRALDEAAKQKILVIATAAIMLIVFYFWFAYFNAIVSNTSSQASLQNNEASSTAGAAPTSGFSAIMLDSAGSLFQFFKDKGREIGGMINGPREYNINPR